MTRRRDYSWLVYTAAVIVICLLGVVVWAVGVELGRWVAGQ